MKNAKLMLKFLGEFLIEIYSGNLKKITSIILHWTL